MSDIHDTKDERNIEIKNVGVSEYILPFTFVNNKKKFISIAKIQSGVGLSANIKGAHLSRINSVLDSEFSNSELSIKDMVNVTKKISKEVGVNNANLKLTFDIIFQKNTPKSNMITNMHSQIEIYINIFDDEIKDELIKISANAAMLCPNSKAKSKYGAHSQKCDISVTLNKDISKINVEKIFDILCKSGSAPVYGIVRSVDEVYMTELAYDNPKFSEDAIRDLIIEIRKIYKSGKIKAELKNYESIHQHNVFCVGEI